MIHVADVRKVYGQSGNTVTALAGISLDVPRGQFLSVMGPSGSGKSTLLHLIGGLDTPTGGQLFIDGRALSTMSDDEMTLFRRRKIGFVFQSFNLLPSLSAEENVALPLLLDGKRVQAVQARVHELLDLVGLADRRTHWPAQMSGGEMQRVAIARALVTNPILLLADEPTGNVDSRAGENILTLLRQAVDRLGQTTLMVTHDSRAAAHGDRIVTIQDGLVVGDTVTGRTPQHVVSPHPA